MSLIRKNILFRYLLSYLAVLLVPITVFGIVSDRYFIAMYRNEAIEQNQLSLERVKNSFDGQTRQLVSMAAQFVSQPSLAASNIRSNPTAYMQIIPVLQGFDFANDFIDGITYYHLGVRDIIYTCSGTFNPKYHPRYTSQGRAAAIEEMLDSLSGPAWICTDENHRSSGSYSGAHLEYAMAVPDMPGAYVVFRISEPGISNIIFGSLEDAVGRSLILDEYGQQLYPARPADPELLDELRPHLAEGADSFAYMRNADEYLLHTRSDMTGLTYVRLVPAAAMLEEVIHRQNLFRFLLICLLLVGGSVVYGMALTHSRPILRLGLLVEDSVKDLPGQLDGIQKAQLAIRRLKERSSSLEQENRRVQRERLLLRLIRGKYATMAAFNRDGEPLGLRLALPRMRVALLYGSGGADADALPVQQQDLPGDMLGPDTETYAIGYPEQNSIILLIAYSRDDSGALRESLRGVCRSLSESWSVPLRFAVGGACGTARDVFDSYLQALSGVKSGIAARSRDSVVIYDDIRHIGRSYAYPKEELDALYAAVTGTRIDKVEFIHDVLVNTIRENYPNRFIITALCYDVVNVYLRAMDALKRPYLEMGDKYAGFIETEGRISIDSLLDVLYRIRDDAIAFLTSLTREAPGDISRVVAYIHEHFRDPDFCASALAESFGMSLSNLSHQFKAQTQWTVSDYINHLKINYAKEMLRGTGLSVSEIAAKLGYIRTSSFIRKFKQHENLTPGEYRGAFAEK